MYRLFTLVFVASALLSQQASAKEFGPYVLAATHYKTVGGWDKCVGAYRTSSEVRMKSCRDTNHYKWYFQQSQYAGWYYIVNYSDRHCLTKHKSKNAMRHYGYDERRVDNPFDCSVDDRRLWRILDDDNNVVDPEFAFSEPYAYREKFRFELKHKEDLCLSYHVPSVGIFGNMLYNTDLFSKTCNYPGGRDTRYPEFHVVTPEVFWGVE